MDKLIQWLLQTTSTGATYLQAIILSILGCIFIFLIAVDVVKVFDEIWRAGNEDKN